MLALIAIAASLVILLLRRPYARFIAEARPSWWPRHPRPGTDVAIVTGVGLGFVAWGASGLLHVPYWVPFVMIVAITAVMAVRAEIASR